MSIDGWIDNENTVYIQDGILVIKDWNPKIFSQMDGTGDYVCGDLGTELTYGRAVANSAF